MIAICKGLFCWDMVDKSWKTVDGRPELDEARSPKAPFYLRWGRCRRPLCVLLCLMWFVFIMSEAGSPILQILAVGLLTCEKHSPIFSRKASIEKCCRTLVLPLSPISFLNFSSSTRTESIFAAREVSGGV